MSVELLRPPGPQGTDVVRGGGIGQRLEQSLPHRGACCLHASHREAEVRGWCWTRAVSFREEDSPALSELANPSEKTSWVRRHWRPPFTQESSHSAQLRSLLRGWGPQWPGSVAPAPRHSRSGGRHTPCACRCSARGGLPAALPGQVLPPR